MHHLDHQGAELFQNGCWFNTEKENVSALREGFVALANQECRSRELAKDLPQANVSVIFHEDFLSFLVTNTFASFLSLQYLFQPLQLP
jgi:hypothetical protein